MPIDTRDKRASTLGVGAVFRNVLPVPDPEPETQADRLQMGYLYRGIAIAFSIIDYQIVGLVVDRLDQFSLEIDRLDSLPMRIEKEG